MWASVLEMRLARTFHEDQHRHVWTTRHPVTLTATVQEHQRSGLNVQYQRHKGNYAFDNPIIPKTSARGPSRYAVPEARW